MTRKPRAAEAPEAPPSATGSGFTRIDLGLAAAIAIITIIAFAAIGTLKFLHWDDGLYVFDNLYVGRGLSLDGMRWALTTGYGGEWLPLTWWSHMLAVQLFGLNPAAHHSINLLLHVVNSLLLFGLMRRMGGAPGRSAFVAALFAVHPMHVEAVAWVSDRKDVLSALFFLLTCWAYVGFIRHRTAPRYVAVIVLFALGLMAKPMLVTLPFVLVLLDVWPLGRAWKGAPPADAFTRARLALPRLLFEKVPLLALSALSCWIALEVRHRYGSITDADQVPLAMRALQPLIAYATYLVKLVLPVNLAAYYPLPQSLVLWQALGASVLLAAITFLVLRQPRRPYLAMGWLWFIGMLIPVMGWVQSGPSVMADRYTYLPYVGLFVMVAWGVAETFAVDRSRTIAAAVAGTIVVLACAFGTQRQVPIWQEDGSLWTHALKVTKDNDFARYQLGVMHAGAGRPAEAMTAFTAAIEDNPRSAIARNAMGATLLAYGQVDAAIAQLEEALKLAPRYSDAQRNLGKALAEAGRYDEAIDHLHAALDGGPGDVVTYIESGSVYARKGSADEAITQFRNALRIQPDHPAAHNNLGTALERRGRVEDAIQHYRVATQIHPQYVTAFSNLGAALFRAGRDREAIPYFEESLRLDPNQPAIHNSLGAALANSGRIEEALPHFEEALRLMPGDMNARANIDSARALLRRR